MYLRAGLVSLGLLLLSRVLGLVRESVQAASFGTTALADVVVTMMTLPDLASSVLAGGALSYALLPWWARQTAAGMAASQRQVAQIFIGIGVILGLWIALSTGLWARWLAPGVGEAMQGAVRSALLWSAVAVPLSLLSLVWYTRLQHERDVVGMYGMNVVHTAVVIAAMGVAVWWGALEVTHTVAVLGAGLLLAFGLRGGFLQWRLARVKHAPNVLDAPNASKASPTPVPPEPVHGLPAAPVWLWALVATGLPVAVPLVARSLVSHSAPGALASFNYAWKLVELPNLLAIQLVATLAFPALTRAHAEGRDFTVQLRTAFALSWTLACAGAVGLYVAALPIADLLFGWGRMQSDQVAAVAQWAALGAWTLLPQSVLSVCTLLLATTGRLKLVAAMYAAVVAVLALGWVTDGPRMMLTLCALLCAAAVALVLASGRHAWKALAWREFAAPSLLCAALAWFLPMVPSALMATRAWAPLVLGALAAAVVLGVSIGVSAVLRAALKR